MLSAKITKFSKPTPRRVEEALTRNTCPNRSSQKNETEINRVHIYESPFTQPTSNQCDKKTTATISSTNYLGAQMILFVPTKDHAHATKCHIQGINRQNLSEPLPGFQSLIHQMVFSRTTIGTSM